MCNTSVHYTATNTHEMTDTNKALNSLNYSTGVAKLKCKLCLRGIGSTEMSDSPKSDENNLTGII